MPDEFFEFFGSVDFRGPRFDRKNLPVALLDNIKAYQELLLDLAEEIWREKNPERQRLPKNFRKNLSLSLSHIEDGSAVAVLKRDESVSAALLPDEYSVNYMALAQSRFLEIARAANEDRPIEGMPAKARNPLKLLLQDLREGEGIEFASRTKRDARNPRVRFSQKTRDRILENTKDDRQKKISGIGIIRSVLDGTEEVEILSESGGFRCVVGRKPIRENKYPIAAFCDFSLFANLRANGTIKSVEEVYSVEVVDLGDEYRRIKAKLQDFRELKSGWRNGEGREFSDEALTFANDIGGFLCGMYQGISVFPQSDGEVTYEFSRSNWEIEVRCRESYIQIEVFDNEMNSVAEQVFFGISPKLIAVLSDIDEFAS